MVVTSMKELHDLEEAMRHDGDQGGAVSCNGSSDGSNFEGGCSSDASTTNPNMTKTDGKSATSESSTLARSETLAVNRSKLAVLFVLTVAAIGVGVATYIFTRNTETKDFEGQVSTVAVEHYPSWCHDVKFFVN